MAFSYTDGSTVEWKCRDSTVIKMTAMEGDTDLARIWFEDGTGALIEQDRYQLRRGGVTGVVAPYMAGWLATDQAREGSKDEHQVVC